MEYCQLSIIVFLAEAIHLSVGEGTKPLAERGMEKIMTGDNDGEQFALNHWLEGGLQLRPPMHAEEAQYSVMML